MTAATDNPAPTQCDGRCGWHDCPKCDSGQWALMCDDCRRYQQNKTAAQEDTE